MEDRKLEQWRAFIKSLTNTEGRDKAFGGAEAFQGWYDKALKIKIPTGRSALMATSFEAAHLLAAVGRHDMLMPVMATIYRKLYEFNKLDEHGVPTDTAGELTEEQVDELAGELTSVLYIALVKAVKEDLVAQLGEDFDASSRKQQSEPDLGSMLGEGPLAA